MILELFESLLSKCIRYPIYLGYDPTYDWWQFECSSRFVTKKSKGSNAIALLKNG
jgi:hypothetical protein